jgi:hypothetical protein
MAKKKAKKKNSNSFKVKSQGLPERGPRNAAAAVTLNDDLPVTTVTVPRKQGNWMIVIYVKKSWLAAVGETPALLLVRARDSNIVLSSKCRWGLQKADQAS